MMTNYYFFKSCSTVRYLYVSIFTLSLSQKVNKLYFDVPNIDSSCCIYTPNMRYHNKLLQLSTVRLI